MKRPLVYMSRCFGFEKCRYDAEMVADEFIESLKSKVVVIHECPETAIGLGCPRNPIRIVRKYGVPQLFQPETGLYFTEKMTEFAKSFAEKLVNVDAFILKAKSPSCGAGNVKYYDFMTGMIINEIHTGVFTAEILKRFPDAFVTDELLLAMPQERELFMSRLFKD